MMIDRNPDAVIESDAAVRARIGPWSSTGLADLSKFEEDTNFVVRAAAGSGKTTSLVARMVALVRRGVDVRSMAAITFTRKAAGEMSERLYRELVRARQALASGPATEHAAVEAALQNLQHSFIGTVHAFCARLLREHPLVVSLPPDFRTGIDEREEEQLRAQAFEGYLQRIHAATPERLIRLEKMGVDLGRLPVFFATLSRYPDLKPYTDGPEEVPSLDGGVREAKALLKKWQARRPDSPIKGRGSVMKMFDRAGATLAYQPPQTTAEKARFLAYFTGVIKKDGKAKVTLSCWGERGSDAYETAYKLRDEELPDLAGGTIEPLLRQWSARVHREVVELLWPAVEYYRLGRRDRGDLTHDDLLYLTRELLRDHAGVRAKIQERYPRLLIDEFQDTDPLQAEILFYLAGSDPGERDWRTCVPRPGSLFIVGDDKQSIYRFRRADREVFDEVARLVGESGGEVIDLTRNFRSLGAICRWCNGAFEELFCDPDLVDVQADYVPLQSSRPMGIDPHGIRHLAIDKKHGNRGRAIAEEDADCIARFIRGAVEGRCEGFTGSAEDEGAVFQGVGHYGDFLILTRTKTRLSIYAGALARYGIPYTVTGSEDLGTSPELRALVGLLTCALRPDDQVACVAYLKGGLCGLSDDELYRYRRAGGRFDRMHEGPTSLVLDTLEAPLAKRMDKALTRICEVRALVTSTRPGVAIERIVTETGLLAGAAHPAEAASGSLRAGQVLRVLTYVRHLIGEGLNWAEIVEELQRITSGEEVIDGMTLETGSGDAVRLMNVHQAKGLQAPVVFLADPYSSRAGSHTPNVHVRRDAGEVVVPIVEGRDFYTEVTHTPLGWHDESEEAFRAEEVRQEEAEEQRLLYVAATRAENLLVLSTYPEKPDKGY